VRGRRRGARRWGSARRGGGRGRPPRCPEASSTTTAGGWAGDVWRHQHETREFKDCVSEAAIEQFEGVGAWELVIPGVFFWTNSEGREIIGWKGWKPECWVVVVVFCFMDPFGGGVGRPWRGRGSAGSAPCRWLRPSGRAPSEVRWPVGRGTRLSVADDKFRRTCSRLGWGGKIGISG